MAITVIREKESGTLSSNRVPYFVYEDDILLDLTRADAVQAALDQALLDAGVGVTDYVDRQESDRAWRVEAIYNETRPGKLTLEPIGNVEIGFRYQAETELVTHSLDTLDSGGYGIANGNAPRFGNLVGIQGGSGTPQGETLKHTGIQVIPRVSNWIRYTIAKGTLTEAYEKQVGDIMGHVNSVPYRGKPIGSLRFVSCSSTIRSDEDMQITFGFDYRPQVPLQTIKAIDKTGTQVDMNVPAYDGHDLFWTYDEVYIEDLAGAAPKPREKILSKQAMYWYIERVHPRSNFATELGI